MNWNDEIPADTAQVGREILTADDPYRLVGDLVSSFLHMKDFAPLYSTLGRSAICPLLLSLITVFQFLENIPDRTAARWAVTRIDWKYALHLPLTWLGFHYSDLCTFRKRLLEHQVEQLVFEKVLEWVRSLGFLRKHGRQRSDSTHMLGCVERMSRLELAWETLRVALRAVQETAPLWYQETIPAVFHEAYVQRQSDWRLSADEVQPAMEKAGHDGFWLLDRLHENAPAHALAQTAVQTLHTVWAQRFERQPEEGTTCVRPPASRGKGKERIVSPHDPEARYSEKRGQGWVGYRWQVTETAEEEVATQFITDVEVTAANEHDSEALTGIQERLIARSLKPDEQYVDQGYPSGPNLARSRARGIALWGPVGGDTAGKQEGYRQSDFVIDMEARQATCPQGKTAPVWYEHPQPDGYVGAEIQFREQCNGCPVRAQCAPGKSGRTINVSPYHELVQQRRSEQQTAAFQEQMNRRSAIEGTISELVRAHGARRARYRGKAKVCLQALFTAAAANLKRLARAWAATAQPRAGMEGAG